MKSYQEFLQELSLKFERLVFTVVIEYTIDQNGKKQTLPIEADIPAPDENAAKKEAEKYIAQAVKKLEQTGPNVRASGKIKSVNPAKR
jgi:hypothetical protein